MTWIELTATVFGFLCVVLTIRRSVWCWPTGLVQVLLFIAVFYEAKLYSDLLLHVIYVFLQFYGWYCWTRSDSCQQTIVVRSLPAYLFATWILVVVLGTTALGWTMQRWTDASLPYPDAFTTVASLVAQVLLAQRYIQTWAFWIGVDVVAIWVYVNKELTATAVLYSAFLILASMGLVIWKQRLAVQSIPNGIPRESMSV